jgi:hypothetical protein
MKVLDLQCAQAHCFEGWFGSEADFISQMERGLVSCPLCGDAKIEKKLSAPRLNLRGGGRSETEPQLPAQGDAIGKQLQAMPVHRGLSPLNPELQARLVQAMREVMNHSEDVGERFADEVRGMHHGDIEQRSIRGQTTSDVAMELMEEGIDVVPLPVLPGLKETLQ